MVANVLKYESISLIILYYYVYSKLLDTTVTEVKQKRDYVRVQQELCNTNP